MEFILNGRFFTFCVAFQITPGTIRSWRQKSPTILRLVSRVEELRCVTNMATLSVSTGTYFCRFLKADILNGRLLHSVLHSKFHVTQLCIPLHCITYCDLAIDLLSISWCSASCHLISIYLFTYIAL